MAVAGTCSCAQGWLEPLNAAAQLRPLHRCSEAAHAASLLVREMAELLPALTLPPPGLCRQRDSQGARQPGCLCLCHLPRRHQGAGTGQLLEHVLLHSAAPQQTTCLKGQRTRAWCASPAIRQCVVACHVVACPAYSSAHPPSLSALQVVTPDLKAPGKSKLLHVDLGAGRRRLGGSALAQAYMQVGGGAGVGRGHAQHTM